jgi:hypothetical protein
MSQKDSPDGRIDAKNLFEALEKGDKVIWGDRSQELTVARHVTEDDTTGQLATMTEIKDYVPKVHSAAPMDAGDLMEGPTTGEEFLIVRGPRNGCYILKQFWDKGPNGWTADIGLFRMNRSGNFERFDFEETITLEKVGHGELPQADFAEGVENLQSDQTDRKVWKPEHEDATLENGDYVESEYNE